MITDVRPPESFLTDSVVDDSVARQTPLIEISPTKHVSSAASHPGNLHQGGSIGEDRLVLLGMVLSALPEVPFEDAARLLGVRPPRLERMMHGGESIPKKFDQEWKTIAVLLGLLHSVLKPAATGRWLNTSIPALGGSTPLMAVEKGKADDVLAVVRAYRDPSFS